MTAQSTIEALKRQLAGLERSGARSREQMFAFGAPAIDVTLGGGLARGALHEVFPAGAGDNGAATGLVLALAARIAGGGPILWARQDAVDDAAGRLYAPGIAEFGLDPGRFILVRARDTVDLLRAAEDALRCPGVGVVVAESWGRPASLSLTATRRLAFAAESSGVTALLLRRGAEPEPSAAETRWSVAAAASAALEANAPGFPVFHLTLLRHRAGLASRSWTMEWLRDRQSFRECPPLSRPVAAPAPHRQAAQVRLFGDIRRAG